jgi:hypothetical protein
MDSRTSFSVSQQLRPELSAKLLFLILSDLPLTRKTEKNVYFSIFIYFPMDFHLSVTAVSISSDTGSNVGFLVCCCYDC